MPGDTVEMVGRTVTSKFINTRTRLRRKMDADYVEYTEKRGKFYISPRSSAYSAWSASSNDNRARQAGFLCQAPLCSSIGKSNFSDDKTDEPAHVGAILNRQDIFPEEALSMTNLFDPMHISALQLPNRFFRSATFDNLGIEGKVSDAQIKLYDALSRGEIGLIISGGLYPARNGMGAPGQLGADNDNAIPSLKRLVDVVHANCGRIAGQILHCGFRSRKAVTGVQPVGPSAMTDPGSGSQVRELSGDEIYEMVENYVQSARRIADAGFDAVQLHAAHGWFLSAFLSPVTNCREDEWGGSAQKRARFLRLICQGIRKMAGPDYPLLVKLGLKDYHPQGKTVLEGIEVAQMLENDGVDAIEVSEGIEQKWGTHIRKDATHPYYIEECLQARSSLKKPLALVGGMRELRDMQAVLDEGIADAVSLCRPFIQDSHIVSKFRTGEAVGSPCNSCNECCERMIEGRFGCVLNE
jgi:2,4-dienoyl-CoA reductase-like NADH-dependent reductase (Old Yellow Enzyme family)